jgi:hypothetical protein
VRAVLDRQVPNLIVYVPTNSAAHRISRESS